MCKYTLCYNRSCVNYVATLGLLNNNRKLDFRFFYHSHFHQHNVNYHFQALQGWRADVIVLTATAVPVRSI